ncbi:MAG TPA: PEP-CTERM sorting domain-containing protein [Vicinamibacterales bacterium]|nr:PEP-CTERM sorting domain-containing protein [Vicinamibacterales bacterium]
MSGDPFNPCAKPFIEETCGVFISSPNAGDEIVVSGRHLVGRTLTPDALRTTTPEKLGRATTNPITTHASGVSPTIASIATMGRVKRLPNVRLVSTRGPREGLMASKRQNRLDGHDSAHVACLPYRHTITEVAPMFRGATRLFVLIAALALVPSTLRAAPIVIDFEAFADGDDLTTQLSGLTFSNTMILTAGISLNELEFPQVSGLNAVFDNGGPMRIDFAAPMFSIGGYFNYLTPLVMRAFGASDNLLDATSSAFSSNLALSGDPGSASNEFLSLAFSGISYVTISGDAFGGSFTLDDLTYDTGRPTSVPEPATLSLVLLGAGMYVGFARLRRKVVDN